MKEFCNLSLQMAETKGNIVLKKLLKLKNIKYQKTKIRNNKI